MYGWLEASQTAYMWTTLPGNAGQQQQKALNLVASNSSLARLT
jgi:hypothetical protein